LYQPVPGLTGIIGIAGAHLSAYAATWTAP
jgi:hypothetical protein